ncbi:MAG: AraC family transcriptional regulator [Burkholderiales bacterium]
MDLLTHLARAADLEGRLLARNALHGRWGLSFECDRSAGFHVVVQGECWLRVGDRAPQCLRRGDVALVAPGGTHALASGPDEPAVPFGRFMPRPASRAFPQPSATLVCGAYRFEETPMHPLFGRLPPIHLIRADAVGAHSPIASLVSLLSAELAERGPGAEAVCARLMDVLFFQGFRHWLAGRPAHEPSWIDAIADPRLGRAIEAVHADPARDWSLESLAGLAAMSRTAFAERFRRTTGDTPMEYVARARIHVAMSRLAASDDTLDAVAAAVGYADAFALSKAFKRRVGCSPSDWRREARRAEDRRGAMPWPPAIGEALRMPA